MYSYYTTSLHTDSLTLALQLVQNQRSSHRITRAYVVCQWVVQYHDLCQSGVRKHETDVLTKARNVRFSCLLHLKTYFCQFNRRSFGSLHVYVHNSNTGKELVMCLIFGLDHYYCVRYLCVYCVILLLYLLASWLRNKRWIGMLWTWQHAERRAEFCVSQHATLGTLNLQDLKMTDHEETAWKC